MVARLLRMIGTISNSGSAGAGEFPGSVSVVNCSKVSQGPGTSTWLRGVTVVMTVVLYSGHIGHKNS